MTDLELMQKIKSELGDYIAGACEGTPFPPSLLAALVANESSGVANAQRFEAGVFAELAEVLVLQKSSYAPAGIKRPVMAGDLQRACWPQSSPVAGKSSDVFTFPQGVLALKNLATSWGPTQIMGWHSLEMAFPLGDLCNLQTHFERTVQLLEWFNQKYGVVTTANLATDKKIDDALAGMGSGLTTKVYESFFHCWNTGSPIAPTDDPEYVPNGLARMALYESLTNAAAA